MRTAQLPLRFILMPFGRKPTAGGTVVDFDAAYHDLIVPAIEQAGLDPLRADEELTGGIIHKPMFERVILCEYAVADLTTANANVFYELGLRHAVRPASTVTLYAEDTGQLPFDVAPLHAIPGTVTPRPWRWAERYTSADGSSSESSRICTKHWSATGRATSTIRKRTWVMAA